MTKKTISIFSNFFERQMNVHYFDKTDCVIADERRIKWSHFCFEKIIQVRFGAL